VKRPQELEVNIGRSIVPGLLLSCNNAQLTIFSEQKQKAQQLHILHNISSTDA
jgi:hypothetical protein